MFEDYQPHPWKTQDPDAAKLDRKGMLLSDQIKRFCEKNLLISEGYKEVNLRPAAYTLTIGESYCDSDGNQETLTPQNPSFEMPPNSIVFVSIAESLDLPYYIAARFNLRVDWVYKGILLGTGPQVEPGFRGKLSCPLYNLTSRAHTITMGKEFATIDFERTTNFVDKTPSEVHSHLAAHGSKLLEYDSAGNKFLLFDQKPLKALAKYPTDYKIISSLVQMQRELALWRKIGIAVVISFITLTLAILNLQNNVLRETIVNGKDLAQVKAQVSEIQKERDQPRQNKEQK
jgi:deoxycytidine triphosphate deaminase